MNQLVIAAAQNYKQPHEDEEQYANRIYNLSLEKATTAADFGKDIHDAIEKYPNPPKSGVLVPWMQGFGVWYDSCVAAVRHREKVLFDHALGLAGRCDFIGEGKGPFEGKVIVPDWKSQNVKKDPKTGKKKPAYYDSWPRQLAFYAISYAKGDSQRVPRSSEIPVCISVVIDSNEPCEPFVKVWSTDEILSAYEDVIIGAYTWFKRKKYFPSPDGLFKVGFSLPIPESDEPPRP